MPHDCDGKLLKKGYCVSMLFVIKEITSEEDDPNGIDCNLILEHAEKEGYLIACNSKFVELDPFFDLETT